MGLGGDDAGGFGVCEDADVDDVLRQRPQSVCIGGGHDLCELDGAADVGFVYGGRSIRVYGGGNLYGASDGGCLYGELVRDGGALEAFDRVQEGTLERLVPGCDEASLRLLTRGGGSHVDNPPPSLAHDSRSETRNWKRVASHMARTI